MENAAKFIVERMEDMAAGIRKPKLPFIMQPSIMTDYALSGLAGASVPAAKHKADLFESLRSMVEADGSKYAKSGAV